MLLFVWRVPGLVEPFRGLPSEVFLGYTSSAPSRIAYCKGKHHEEFVVCVVQGVESHLYRQSASWEAKSEDELTRQREQQNEGIGTRKRVY
jgi:hypothetical protein